MLAPAQVRKDAQRTPSSDAQTDESSAVSKTLRLLACTRRHKVRTFDRSTAFGNCQASHGCDVSQNIGRDENDRISK